MIDIEKQFVEVWSEVLGIPVSKFDRATGIGTIPAWDSVAHVQLIAACEAKFEIEFDILDAIELETADDFIELLDEIINE